MVQVGKPWKPSARACMYCVQGLELSAHVAGLAGAQGWANGRQLQLPSAGVRSLAIRWVWQPHTCVNSQHEPWRRSSH